MSFKAVFLFALVLTALGCTKSRTRDPFVTTRLEVYEKSYLENESVVAGFLSGVAHLEGLSSFGTGAAVLKGASEQDLLRRLLLLETQIEFNRDSFQPTEKNCVLIFDRSNEIGSRHLADFIGYADFSESWSMTEASEESTPFNRSGFMQLCYRSKNGNWPESFGNDSLTETNIGWVKGKFEKELTGLREKKYALLVDDMIYSPPVLTSKDSFESGLLLVKTELYEVMSGDLLAREYHPLDNNFVVQYTEYHSPDEKVQPFNLPVEERLKNDLIKNRRLVVLDHYGMLNRPQDKYKLPDQ